MSSERTFTMLLLALLIGLIWWVSDEPGTMVLDNSQCQEDTGCPDGRPWDCTTMGNRICGEIGTAWSEER